MKFLFLFLFLFLNVNCGFLLTCGAAYLISSQEKKNSTVSKVSITTEYTLNAIVGVEYSFVYEATKGTIPYRWEVITTHLPEGLSLNTETGELSGIPTKSGIYDFQISVFDKNNLSDTKSMEIIVFDELNIGNIELIDGTCNKIYLQNLIGVGGKQPYSFNLESGSLPTGLSLSELGVISGTVSGTALGIYNFAVKCIDSNDDYVKQSVIKNYSIEIKAESITITSPSGFEEYLAGKEYAIEWTTTGFVSTMNIELWKNDSKIKDIALNIENTGSYLWTIANSEIIGSDYKIKMISCNDNEIIDFSDDDFNINWGLEIISPNGSEEYELGELINIQWNTYGVIESVNLELWQGSAKLYDVVLETNNLNSYSWQIFTNLIQNNNYKIKIVSEITNDLSDDFFSIVLGNPKNVDETAMDKKVFLNWNNVLGANSYRVLMTETSGMNYVEVFSGLTESECEKTGLINETTYYFVVIAVNGYGESEYSEEVSSKPFVNIYTSVECGLVTAIAIRLNKDRWSWGYNGQYNYLGNTEAGETSNIPVKTLNMSNVIKIAMGDAHNLVLKEDGTVWAWGFNNSGQLGNGTTTNNITPTQISGLQNIIDIAGGCYNSVALKNDGTVWCWGNGANGEMGNGTFITFNKTPIQATSINNVIAISSGENFIMALKNDGTVWTWGSNLYGQLGDGTLNNSSVAVQMLNLTNIIKIACAGSHAIALKNDGTVWTCGINYVGQLGNGTVNNSSTPVQVLNLTNITDIFGGFYHSFAIKNDGTVWTWGGNNYGQLGDGTTNNSSIPVQVLNLTNIIAASGGQYFSMALKNDGTIWCWGKNEYGQLGNGTYNNSLIPVQAQNVEE